jgi:hypothetical protein
LVGEQAVYLNSHHPTLFFDPALVIARDLFQFPTKTFYVHLAPGALNLSCSLRVKDMFHQGK